jgi:hypothetical protein
MYKCFYINWDLIYDLLDKSWFEQLWLEKWNLLPNIYLMMDFEEVCASCAKSAHSFVLSLILLKIHFIFCD